MTWAWMAIFSPSSTRFLAVFQDIRFKILDRDAAKCATDVLHAVRDNQPVEAAFQFFDAVLQNIAVQRTPAVRAEQVYGNAAQHELAGCQGAVAATREHDQLRILRNLHGCVSSQEMRSELAEIPACQALAMNSVPLRRKPDLTQLTASSGASKTASCVKSSPPMNSAA